MGYRRRFRNTKLSTSKQTKRQLCHEQSLLDDRCLCRINVISLSLRTCYVLIYGAFSLLIVKSKQADLSTNIGIFDMNK